MGVAMPLFSPADSQDAKRWQHRARTPEDTCLRLRPVQKAAGITRVADITGLDYVGIPVFQAVRPLGRLLSVSQGKGQTAMAARASAVMEAVEIWHAETENLDRVLSSRKALGTKAHIDPNSLLRPQGAAVSCFHPVSWSLATDLRDGSEVLVPGDAANLDFTREADLQDLARSTTGLAGGNTIAEARASALAEIIERRCRAEFETLAMTQRAARRLDPFCLAADEPGLSKLIGQIFDADLKLELFDITNRYGVTTIRAAVFELARGRPAAWPSLGFGTHLDPVTAVSRALTEAAQSRLTGISGNRDDIDPRHYSGADLANNLRNAFGTWDLSGEPRGLCQQNESTASSDGDANLMLERIFRFTDGPVAEVNLSRPDIGVPVVKLLAPNVAYLATR